MSAPASLRWGGDFDRGVRAMCAHARIRLDRSSRSSSPGPARPLSSAIQAARNLGAEALDTDCAPNDLRAMLHRCAPAFVELPDAGREVLALVRTTRTAAVCLDTRGEPVRVPLAEVVSWFSSGKSHPQLSRVLTWAGVTTREHAAVVRRVARDTQDWRVRVQAVLVRGSLARPGIWTLRESGALRHLALAVAAAGGLYVASMLAWAVLGRGALAGHVDEGWNWAWALLIASAVPLVAITAWSSARFALELAQFLKRRTFQGALLAPAETLTGSGLGEHMGRVLESESLDSVAATGAFAGVVALLQLALGAGLLWSASAPALGMIVLAVVFAWLCLAFGRYLRKTGTWVDARLRLTHDLFEKMAGHATRVVQELPERWHDREDDGLTDYHATSKGLDRERVVMGSVPSVWLVLGTLVVGRELLAGSPVSTIAILVGGVILTRRGLEGITRGLGMVGDLWVSWRRVRWLVRCGAAPTGRGPTQRSAPQSAAINVANVTYAHPSADRRLLDGCNLQIPKGEKLILTGSSGSGKSTLACLLSGALAPQAGLILVDGQDLQTMGASQWRRKVVLVPQYHDNHVFSGSLLFNLLAGHQWPPAAGDHARAEAVCRSLGLGPLIDRMPAGLAEHVGDHGWRLSHGEQSRVFLARALLQRDANLLLIDEGCSALDPATTARVLAVLRDVPQAVMLIGHP